MLHLLLELCSILVETFGCVPQSQKAIVGRPLKWAQSGCLLPHFRRKSFGGWYNYFQVDSGGSSGGCRPIFFFPSPVWPIRTRLGPYICVSNEKQYIQGHVWSKNVGKSSRNQRQTKNNKTTTTKNDPQIPQPDLRFASKQNSEATKNGAGPNKQTHSDLP